MSSAQRRLHGGVLFLHMNTVDIAIRPCVAALVSFKLCTRMAWIRRPADAFFRSCMQVRLGKMSDLLDALMEQVPDAAARAVRRQ